MSAYPWERGLAEEVARQRRAETWLMIRGATILVVITALVIIRSLLL